VETQLFVSLPRDRVFKFFADPANLERITPSWLHFEIVTAPGTKIRQGTLLDYRLRLRGVPLRWQSEITVWQPPCRFVDRQTKGPFSLWVHEHTFSEKSGGTIVEDRVEYAVPGGRCVHRFLGRARSRMHFPVSPAVLEALFNSDQRTMTT